VETLRERKPMMETAICRAPGGERPAREEGMGECAEHNALFEARADEEAWGLAHNILRPWLESARYIGSDELTQVLEKAFREVEDNVDVALDNIELAEAALEKEAGA
jgi:hypothetical protein